MQFGVAVSFLSLSVIALFLNMMKRQQGWQGWIAVNIVVLIIGAGALRWLPNWSGLIVAVTFILLIPAPNTLFHLANRQVLRGRMRLAAFWGQLAGLLHPTAQYRLSAAILAARAYGTTEQNVAALRALAPRATPEQQAFLVANISSEQADWSGILGPSLRVDDARLIFLAIRACGELGRIDEMVQLYSQVTGRLGRLNMTICYLYILAFGGRPRSVDLLLAQQLSFLQTKNYWRAIAAKASGAGDADWRPAMAIFAATTTNEAFRRAAERHLAEPSNRGSPASSSESIATIDAFEERLPEELRRMARPRAPVTLILIVLIVVGFLAEMSHGGSGNPNTLIELGALSAPLVLQNGEWWRLVTAWFLHYGPFHFWISLYLMLVLGIICEISAGSRRMFALYSLGGLASSTTALWMMWGDTTADAFFVGSSGGVFAFVGSQVGGQLRDRSYWRRALNWHGPRSSISRSLIIVVGVILWLWMDVTFEMHELHLKFIAYAPAFVAGLAISLAFGRAARTEA